MGSGRDYTLDREEPLFRVNPAWTAPVGVGRRWPASQALAHRCLLMSRRVRVLSVV